ncbi:SMP-30/gluconolactonase/LRE family protein [Bradyrhizobium manausense]|uniref:SMP-30/gluconolactonase/LRE family protein n=1 Tax=Bradyrhizobium TaxID=374 RepID=UPI001BAAB86F|nr:MULTISPECIES: SMP-30/gluconolactonase/LRE family protein [Bradyrhizobium]MBR0825129.1 SMP-30/gluconolactonase/LRE family protein [Bradyrhizobium manausense]UVO32428.1 SMP-30/gluconolactonase/LRE family protein [Bradyrhizobium arachidis]
MSAPHITRVGATKDQLGESPVWDHRAQLLYWIDSLAGLIRRWSPASSALEAFEVAAPIGSMALRKGAGAIAALRHGFGTYDFDTRQLTPGSSIGLDHPMVRLNDGKVDPYGRFVAGTMHGGRGKDEPPLGGLYRLNGPDAVELLETDLGVSNGPCFSPDGRTFYLADSARSIIWAYDYGQEGPLTNKRVFVDTTPFGSGPDGATVDADGCLWSVLVRVGAIAQFTPDGRLARKIELPVRHPTSACFGGPNLDVLYVTSISRSTHLADDSPEAGALFAIEGLGVTGLSAQLCTTG